MQKPWTANFKQYLTKNQPIATTVVVRTLTMTDYHLRTPIWQFYSIWIYNVKIAGWGLSRKLEEESSHDDHEVQKSRLQTRKRMWEEHRPALKLTQQKRKQEAAALMARCFSRSEWKQNNEQAQQKEQNYCSVAQKQMSEEENELKKARAHWKTIVIGRKHRRRNRGKINIV